MKKILKYSVNKKEKKREILNIVCFTLYRISGLVSFLFIMFLCKGFFCRIKETSTGLLGDRWKLNFHFPLYISHSLISDPYRIKLKI